MEIPIAAIKKLLEIAENHEDRGPFGEGWQSEELMSAIYEVETWVEAVKNGPLWMFSEAK